MEKNTGKVREFCHPGKVGTLINKSRTPADDHCNGRYASYWKWNAFLSFSHQKRTVLTVFSCFFLVQNKKCSVASSVAQ